MEAVVVSFKGGKRTRYTSQMIVKVDGVDNKDKAKSLLNKKVVWESPAGKKITGEVISPHGNNGCVKVRFEKGLPGQSLGTKVKIA